MMRLWCLIALCLCCVGLPAQTVNLSLHDAPLSEALRRIDQGQQERRIVFVFNEMEMYYVRLEDGDGNNLLDTADALAKEPVSYECQIIRESDQALMTFEQRRVNDDHDCETFGPLLCLQWSDFDLLSDKDKPIVYEQAYTTHLQITHADVTEQHRIRWNLRVEGKMHCVTSCEVDGQEVEANVVVKVKGKS